MRSTICCILVLALCAPFAVAEEETVGEIAGDRVRLRAGPGTKHTILAVMDKGDLVVSVGSEGQWLKVRVPGGFPCYVHESLMRREKDGTAVVTSTRVLVRPTASKDLLPLETVLDKGDLLVVLGVEGEWVRVLPPPRTHLYVFVELVTLLGPIAEYRGAVNRFAESRKAVLLGERTEDLELAKETRRAEFRKQALAAGDALLAGKGDTAELRRVLAKVSLESDDDLTQGYANALLALLSLREDSERLRAQLDALGKDREGELKALGERLDRAERQYKEALENAQTLRAMRSKPYRGVGEIRRQGDIFLLVENGQTLFRIVSSRFRLEDFAGKRVGINGRMVVIDSKTGATQLLVEKIEIMPAGTRSR